MPRSQLERLLAIREDARDTAAYLAAKGKQQEEAFPSYFVDALMDGTAPLKTWRKYRGLSQVQLAKQVGTTQPVISSLEQPGARLPKLGLASRLADALACDMDDLFEL